MTAEDSLYRVGGMELLPDAIRPIQSLLRDNRHAKAESLGMALVERIASDKGDDAIETAIVLDWVVQARAGRGMALDSMTWELAERALAIKERSRGADHPMVAISLRNLAWLYDARAWREKRGSEREELLDLSKELYERAIAIQEIGLGPDHSDLAWTLSQFGTYSDRRSQFEAARPLQERAVAIYERTGIENRSAALARHRLALAYMRDGDPRRAERMQIRTLAAFEKSMSPDHPHVVIARMMLANYSRDCGNSSFSREMLERNLALIDSLRVRSDGRYAYSENRNALALTLMSLGSYSEADELFGDLLTENVEEGDSSGVAQAAMNLGAMLVEVGDYGRARGLFHRALVIDSTDLGMEHRFVADDLLAEAHCQLVEGDLAAARSGYARARSIHAKTSGPESYGYALTLHGLADVCLAQEAFAEAETFCAGARSTYQLVLGPDHPEVGSAIRTMAKIRLARGDRAGALKLALEADRIGREHLELGLGVLSEREALQLTRMRIRGLDVALRSVFESSDTESNTLIWDSLIRSRGGRVGGNGPASPFSEIGLGDQRARSGPG
jgi:tetratricopeptide (TPR) repeat protein